MYKTSTKVSSRNNVNMKVLFLGEKYNVQTRQTQGGVKHYKVELKGNELISWDSVNYNKYFNTKVKIDINKENDTCIVIATSIELLKEAIMQITSSIKHYYRNFVAQNVSKYNFEKEESYNEPWKYTIVLNDTCDKDRLFDLFTSVCETVEFINEPTLLITYFFNNETLVNLRLAKLIADGCIEAKKRSSNTKTTAKYAGKVTFRGEEKIIVVGTYETERIYSITIYISLTDPQVEQINSLFTESYKKQRVVVRADKNKLFIFAYDIDDIKNNIALIEEEIDNIICSDLHHKYTTNPIQASKLNDATRCGCKFLKQDTTNNNKSPTTYFNIKFDKEYCKTKLQGGTRKNKTKNTLKRRQTKKTGKNK